MRPPSTRRRLATVTIAVLALLAVFTQPGQAAVARVVHTFGVVLHLSSPAAPARPEQLPGESGTALEQARRLVHFTVVVPEGLGPPDRVTLSDGGRVLSLIYAHASGRPSPGPGGVSARLDEFDGTVDVAFLKQLSAPAEWIQLPDDSSAVWISAPHDVTYVDRDGNTHTESARLAAHTLIWTVGAVTLRLEGGYSRDQAHRGVALVVVHACRPVTEAAGRPSSARRRTVRTEPPT